MPKYLNSHQKEIITNLAAFHSGFEDIVDTWEELDRPKDQIKYLKSARTFAMKVIKLMQESVDDEQVRTLIENVNQREIVLTYTDRAKKERKKREKLENNTVIDTDDFYDFINAGAVANCKGCEDDPKECDLKRLFLQYNVPVANYGEIGEECPYKL